MYRCGVQHLRGLHPKPYTRETWSLVAGPKMPADVILTAASMPVSCQLMTTDLRSGATVTATKPLLYPACAPCTHTSASAQEIN